MLKFAFLRFKVKSDGKGPLILLCISICFCFLSLDWWLAAFGSFNVKWFFTICKSKFWHIISGCAEYGTHHHLGKIGDGIRLCKLFLFGFSRVSFEMMDFKAAFLFSSYKFNAWFANLIWMKLWNHLTLMFWWIPGAGIDPDLLLAVFLPALLFESSFSMEVHQIKVILLLYLLVPLSCQMSHLRHSGITWIRYFLLIISRDVLYKWYYLPAQVYWSPPSV